MTRIRRKLLICFVSTIVIIVFYLVINNEFGSKYSDKIPVFVVEEHHEALPYWIDVANEGVIPKKGNTLVHIDGHADDGLPHYVLSFPFFKWPADDFEVFLMMQQNDIFIVAGTIIGLIDRFIWISPEWNKDTETVEHDIVEIEIGWTKIKRNKDEEIIVFCKCAMNDDHDKYVEEVDKPAKSCVYLNDSFQPPGDPEIDLKPASLCEIKSKFTFEVLSAKKASELMNSDSTWIAPEDTIILDIDEDYFGCEIPGQKLYDVGMNWKNFESLNAAIAQLFCPKHIDHEQSGSVIMTKLINTILSKCGHNEIHEKVQYGNFSKQCKVSLNALSVEIYRTVLESWKLDPLLYCSRNNGDLKLATDNLAAAFYFLSPVKLKTILNVGFCFNTSPQTLWFEDDGNLVICHGNNDPDKPMVQVYIPKKKKVPTATLR